MLNNIILLKLSQFKYAYTFNFIFNSICNDMIRSNTAVKLNTHFEKRDRALSQLNADQLAMQNNKFMNIKQLFNHTHRKNRLNHTEKQHVKFEGKRKHHQFCKENLMLQFQKQKQIRSHKFNQLRQVCRQIQNDVSNTKANQENLQKIQRLASPVILNYVTQINTPQMLQCSSQTNLLSARNQIKQACYYISAIIAAYFQKPNTTAIQLCRNHFASSIQLMKVSKKLEKPINTKRNSLPRTHKKTIVFDLDETLIHCNQNPQMKCDVILKIFFPNGQHTRAGINIRPYAVQCLKQLSQLYQIAIFTASHQYYGNVVINYLDPKGQYVSHRYFRDSCYKSSEGFYVKDLRVIDRPIENILLIDNAAYSYAFQVENGVPILPFYDDKADKELKYLTKYLKGLANTELRAANNGYFKTEEYWKYSEPVQLINKLYKQFIMS